METASLSQFLNYGGLGLLAILCIVVLGYNVWSLNGLVAKAEPDRINAARPLLLGQMAISLIGLLAVGAGGIYLDRMKGEDSRIRSATIFLDPWDDGLDANSLPVIRIAGNRSLDRPINFDCTPGRPVTVMMNLEPFIRHRVQASMAAQRALLPIGAAGAGH
ncbi:MAG TPA: hypothetical protein VK614_08130 [Allosphingosinicella sp.]|nr:hypothetical protein [Allosphingosinicella sp.]